MSSEHLFWGDDLPKAPNLGTTDSILLEFTDLHSGVYNLTVYSASSWHDPHRGMQISVVGQTKELRPGKGNKSYVFQPRNIKSYLDENIRVTFRNLAVRSVKGNSGTLLIKMNELGTLDPSLAGIILTQVSTLTANVGAGEFVNDMPTN